MIAFSTVAQPLLIWKKYLNKTSQGTLSRISFLSMSKLGRKETWVTQGMNNKLIW